MANYQINKGIGKSVEFQGLTMKYIYILAGGVIAIFLLFVVMSIAGLSNSANLSIVGVSTAILLWQTFALNKKYGEHGAMKRQARSYHPRYIINRVKFQKLFTRCVKH
ncbi:MAG: DUF4133 domain-containing protein [Rikenellaceae bacterium]